MLPIFSIPLGLPLPPDVVLDVISLSETVNLYRFILETDVTADESNTVVTVSPEVIIGGVDFAKDARQNHFAFYTFGRHAIIIFVDLQLRAVRLCGRNHLICPSEVGVNWRFGAITDAMFRAEKSGNVIVAWGNHD